MAIDIDSARFNAHKNLGLAVAGQGRYLEAARCLAEAVKLAPGVPRAFEALAEMVATHPEVLDQDAEWAQCWDQIRKDRESGNRRT